jgi:hypothetical protein
MDNQRITRRGLTKFVKTLSWTALSKLVTLRR